MAGLALYSIYRRIYMYCIDEVLKSFHSLNFFERGAAPKFHYLLVMKFPSGSGSYSTWSKKDITDRGTDNNKGLPKGVQNVK